MISKRCLPEKQKQEILLRCKKKDMFEIKTQHSFYGKEMCVSLPVRSRIG